LSSARPQGVAWAIGALLFIVRNNAAENLTDLLEMTE
jgi:hypothetical protein